MQQSHVGRRRAAQRGAGRTRAAGDTAAAQRETKIGAVDCKLARAQRDTGAPNALEAQRTQMAHQPNRLAHLEREDSVKIIITINRTKKRGRNLWDEIRAFDHFASQHLHVAVQTLSLAQHDRSLQISPKLRKTHALLYCEQTHTSTNRVFPAIKTKKKELQPAGLWRSELSITMAKAST